MSRINSLPQGSLFALLHLSAKQWSSDSWILINVELRRGTAHLEKQHFRSAREKAVKQLEQPGELSHSDQQLSV